MHSIAVVTGAAGGIGRAIAAKLSESHDHVVLVDVDESKTKGILDHLQDTTSSGSEAKTKDEPRFLMAICDVTDSDAVAEMARKISSLGSVHTLVNNAGATQVDSLHDMTPEAWRRETSLNLDAAFICFHAFADALEESHGSVINIASVNGLSVFGNPAYSAAKAGLIHLTKSIAVEYGRLGVRANAVAPGTVRTAAWDVRAKENPHIFDDAMQWYPLKRVIEPADVANAVAFLASDQAGAITGVCLPVDCGLMAGQAPVARTFTQSDDYK
jgi:NAD(P)-dependent dehydrogenase (short-subunit alcohol dehydrogenase family)